MAKEIKKKSDRNNREEKENKKEIEKKNKAPGFFNFLVDKFKKRNQIPDDLNRNMIQKIESVIEEFHETRERHKKNVSTYEQISGASKLSIEFFILLISSSLIAAFGLMQNSAAVIIGAMIIAPLMMPILGFALGSIWGDRHLLFISAVTLFTGILSAIALTAVIGFIMPGIEVNEQILARTNPTLYDIIIALASGFVGSYAFVNPKISGSISGVAIAVALVPPLAVTGISLGTFQWQSAFGSFLLFASNLVSISLAASLVFWKMKVHPASSEDEEVSQRAKRNLFLSTVLLIVISVPLVFFMKETLYIKAQTHKIEKAVISNFTAEEINIQLNKYFETYQVSCKIISLQDIDIEHKNKVIADIQKLFQSPVEIKIIIVKAM
jgi:uncharacterized hydrophobic protein (TIGR00271 family)